MVKLVSLQTGLVQPKKEKRIIYSYHLKMEGLSLFYEMHTSVFYGSIFSTL